MLLIQFIHVYHYHITLVIMPIFIILAITMHGPAIIYLLIISIIFQFIFIINEFGPNFYIVHLGIISYYRQFFIIIIHLFFIGLLSSY